MIKKIFTLLLIATVIIAYSEENSNTKGGKISGSVIDSSNKTPVEYATIGIYSEQNKLITGAVTDSKGNFSVSGLHEGIFSVKVTFMGYKTITISNVTVSNIKNTELGDITLELNTEEIEAVDIIGKKRAIEYKIDKKVVNVSQHLTSISGSAVDVLENVPSVKVDIDGNVTLRGSGNFTVLIDGTPTILAPSDALAQIPAENIENIEIITNPSAKYNPEGTSGILNIITKKNKLSGISGVISTSVSNTGEYGGNATVEVRNKKLSYNIGADYNNNNMPGTISFYRWNRINSDTVLNQTAFGDFSRSRSNWNIKSGFEYKFSENNTFGFNAGIGNFNMIMASNKMYSEWLSPIFDTTIYHTDNNNNISMNFVSAGFNYKHIFEKEHTLEVKTNYNSRIKEQKETGYSYFYGNPIYEGKITGETGPSSSLEINADYTKPIIMLLGKFESGIMLQLSQRKDNTTLHEYDTNSYTFVNKQQYNNTTNYKRDVYAAYGILSGEAKNLGYQGGLRMEYTYRTLNQLANSFETKITRPDFFPTIHMSYKLPSDQQTFISYTRRIVRPKGWLLEPHTSWIDANNVRKGNPDLLPEYINSFESGYQKSFGNGMQQSFISAEIYYRITQNKTERIMMPWDDNNNIILQTFKNVGTDYALGGEFTVNYSPTKWFTINWMSDFYNYSLLINYDSVKRFENDFSWNTRINNTFKLSKNTRLQLNGSYWSAKIGSQGTSGSMYSIDAALKQDFFDRKLSATLQVRDILGTRKHTFDNYSNSFYQYTEMKPEAPIFSLSLSYRINNYKSERKGRTEGGNGDMEENGF